MLTLYEHPFALYCQKVLIALNELGIAYEVLEEQRDFDRAELGELWPPASTQRARTRLDMAYAMLESQLAPRELLAGDEFTIADCAAAPGLFYALAIHPWDEDTHPQLTRYYRGLAQRPSFAKVIADARPYRHLFPLPWPADFDRYH